MVEKKGVVRARFEPAKGEEGIATESRSTQSEEGELLEVRLARANRDRESAIP